MLRPRAYARKAALALRHASRSSGASRGLSAAAGEASAAKPGWWGVSSPERFKAGVLGKLEDGEGLMLRATHASEAAFLRDVAAALQAVLESSLQQPDKVTAALSTKSPTSELPEDVATIRKVLRRLVGDRMLETIELDAKTRATDDSVDQAGRKVWLHSLNLAGVRSHAIARRPAAPDAASGGLLYNSQHNCLVESREGECYTLLTPWGIAVTNPGFIRPRVDALDNAASQRRSKPADMSQAMEMAAKEAQEEEEGRRRAGVPLDAPPIPPGLMPATKVLVQARVVFGTLEMAGGKLLAPGIAEEGPLEQPQGWRARQWKQSWGAARADVDGWGVGKASETVGTAGAESSEIRKEALAAAREHLAKALESDAERLASDARSARAVADKTGGLGLGRASGAALVDQAAAQIAASIVREASAKAAIAAAAQGEHSDEGDDGESGDATTTGLEAAEVGSVAAKHLRLADGDAKEANRLAELVQDEVALQGVLAQYTHWHEATMEIVLTRPAPSWSRFMTSAQNDGNPEEAEDGDDDAGKHQDEDQEAGSSHGSAAAERAENLRRDLKRGVLSDTPGRSGAGPAGSPVGLEAVLTRINWEIKGFLGLCVRAITRMTGGIILRGPDMVPEPAKWRVVGIDEGVPPGWWEADRRASAAWQTAEALASSRLVSENGDWTEVAEALASMPRRDLPSEAEGDGPGDADEDRTDDDAVDSAMEAALDARRRWPAPPAIVADRSPQSIPSDLLLVMRTRTPLMRHWPPAALGVFPAAASIRAAVRDTASWQFEEAEEASDSEADAPAGRDEGEQAEADFGVTWHDGWTNKEADTDTILLPRETFGSRIGMGDGRWAGKSTAALDHEALGDIEAVAASGDEDSEAKPDTESQGEAASLQAAGVEYVKHMPSPPSWARSAMKQMVALAKNSRA